jgi:hypothetical protein
MRRAKVEPKHMGGVKVGVKGMMITVPMVGKIGSDGKVWRRNQSGGIGSQERLAVKIGRAPRPVPTKKIEQAITVGWPEIPDR